MKRRFFYYLLLFTTIFDASAQVVMASIPPFQIVDAVKEERGQSNVQLTIKLVATEKASFESIYFLGHWAMPEVGQDQSATILSVQINRHEKRINMHSDPRREAGNQPPLLKTSRDRNPEFALAADEAVLLYKKEGRACYFKLSGIRDKLSKQG